MIMRKIKKAVENNHKPIIETIINSAALSLTAFGVQQIINNSPHFPFGYLALMCGVGLEFFKYLGRNKKLW